jgi:taurine dioxygenase
MLTIEPTGAALGATARGIDLAQPLSEPDLAQVLLALGKHGVLRFPDQRQRDNVALRRLNRTEWRQI